MHDLARDEPGRVARMTADWNAWAVRCGVTPAPPRAVRGTIDLQPNQTLAGAEAPNVANVPFRIEAEVREASRGGVIASQGAQVQGWALFVRDRRSGLRDPAGSALFELTAERTLGDNEVELAGELSETARPGSCGRRRVARGCGRRPIPNQPTTR